MDLLRAYEPCEAVLKQQQLVLAIFRVSLQQRQM